MSQYNFGNLVAPLTGTALIDTHLEPWRDALHTMHSGSSRPSYAVAGLMWLDTTTTPWTVKVFDGTDDISIGTINATTNLFAAANAASSTNPTLTGTISGSAAPKINNFRLTLTTGVPVTTSDVTAASTIFLTPYNGNQIALYTAGQWVLLTSSQVSIALSGLTSNRPYDVFAYNNAGTVTLEVLAWTSDTARATALAYQDGVLVKSGDASRRYLGTFYATGATTTEDSQANRYLWNYYNRANRTMYRLETAASWTYTTSTPRQANANSANQLNFVVGVAEDVVTATVIAAATNATTTSCYAGIGLNNTTPIQPWGVFTVTSQWAAGNSSVNVLPALGRNTLLWLEYSSALGTTTWYGTGLTGGITGRVNA
jgi:hypothetical protein